MKHSITIMLFCMFLLLQGAYGQISLTLNMRTPTPSQLSVWERDRTVIQAIITNAGSTTYPNVRPSFTIRNLDNSQIVAFSKDNDPGMLRFAIPPTTTIVKNGPELVNADAVSIDQGIKTIVTTTNSLPEGTYEICLNLLAENGTPLTSVPVCRTFLILIPDPPTLIVPANGDSLASNAHPTFTWTPVIAGPGVAVRYRLVIAPVYQGQTPKNAVDQNQPLYNQLVFTSSLFYGPSLPQFTLYPQATGFAWQVQAVNTLGEPVTRNDGKSEVYSFKVSSSQPGQKLDVVLLSNPDNNSDIVTRTPAFQWSHTPPTGTSVNYKIRVAPITGLQTPTQALASNAPVFDLTVPGTQKSVTPSVQLNLQNNGKYAWRVQAIKAGTSTVMKSSHAFRFTFKENIISIIAGMSKVSGTLQYEFADIGEYAGWPLANVNIKLVIKYVLKYKSHTTYGTGTKNVSGSMVVPSLQLTAAKFNDKDKVLAVAKTSATGDFSLNFWHFDTTGIVQKDFISGSTGGEFFDYYKGDLYKVYRIVVENPYYCSPNDDIQLKPGDQKTLGNVFAYVRSYALTVKVSTSTVPEQQATHGPLAGMTVYLLRKTRPQGVPANEGLPHPAPVETMFGMEVVAKGITSGNPPGLVTFKRAVKNIGPNDKYYVYTASDPEKGKWNYKGGYLKVQFPNDADKATFNAEYKYLNFTYELAASPIMPAVRGRIVLSGEGTPVEGAKAQLLKYALLFWSEERNATTPANGTFTFPYLPTLYDENGIISGPLRGLRISKQGYKQKQLAVPAAGAILKPGEQWVNQNIELELGATVKGKVVDPSGEGVNSFVMIGDFPAVNATSSFINMQTWKWAPASFHGKAEKKPQPQRIIIEPKSTAFFRETTFVTINNENVDLGNLTVHRKLHKIVLLVREETPNMPFAVWPKVAGAKVKVKDLNLETTTNTNGEAKFEFASDGSQFTFIVTAPPGKYYLRKEHSMTHQQGKWWKFEPVGVEKATFVSGHVYVGKDKKPVGKARVFIDQGSQSNRIQTETDASGSYLLPNVPIGELLTVWATKPSEDTTYVGDSVNVLSKTSGNANVDFTLSIYNGMDITKLMGFPVEVQQLQELSGGKVQVSGTFTQFLSNEQFAVLQDSSSPGGLTFSQVQIKPGTVLNSKGIPIAQPATLPVSTNQNSFDINVYNTFAAELKDQNIGIHLDDPGTGLGVIKGRVRVGAGQFNTGGSFANWSGFNLALPGVSGPQKLILPAITATGNAPVNAPQGLLVVAEDGDSLHLTMNEFPATADPAKSYLFKDTVRLHTTLHTNIPHITPGDLNLTIGDIRFRKDGVAPITSSNTISMKLDQWTLEATQWSFFQSDIVVTQGALKTGKIDIPVQSLNIKPTALINAEFNLASLSVGGIVPLTVTASPVMNYDVTKSEWFLFISTGGNTASAYMSNLPGMEPGAKILFKNIRLTSKGAEQFSPLTTPLTIYKVAKLTPDMVSVFPDFVEVSGLTLSIPKVGSLNAAIHYSKGTGGEILFRLVPVPIVFSTNGVVLKFGVTSDQAETQKLNEQGFVSRGTVSEEGKFSLVSWLRHTEDSTSVWVETTPKQSLPIGAPKTSMQDITGSMRVLGSDWTNFWFAGDLQGTKGITDEKKRLTFTVVGEITANNQELAVKNIPGPFGGMNWRYDFENSRLTGDMTINKSFGGLSIQNGVAECVVDGSGWYFIAGGVLNVPGIGGANAALLFGDYPTMTQGVKDKFANASYNKKLPAAFESNISGFLFSGAISVPVIIPDIDVDLIIASAKFGIKAGADVRVWRGFDGEGTEYGIGALAFIHAYLTMSSITCTELTADAKAELGFTGTYNTGPGTFSLDGCGGFSLGAHLTQKFWGCDLDGCGCHYTIFSEGFNFAFKGLMHLDSGGGKSLNFAKGTCSGN